MKAQAKTRNAKNGLPPFFGNDTKHRFLQYACIAALALVVYLPSAWYDFTGFDDEVLIRDNYPVLTKAGNLNGLFTSDVFLGKAGKGASVFYRPMQTLSYMADALAGGGHPQSHHATNIVLHCVISCLIAAGLALFRIPRFGAVLAGALFAVHPVFVPAVVWLPSRGDMLITLAALAALLLFDRALRGNGIAWLLPHALCFLIAVFSKETAVLLPVLFVLYAALYHRGPALRKQLAVAACCWIAVLAVWFVCRSSAQLDAPGGMLSNLGVLFSFFPVTAEYLSRLVFPYSVAPLPRYTIPGIAGGAAVFALLVFAAVRSGRLKDRNVLFGLAWYCITLLPVLLYRHELGGNAYDFLFHRLYLPVFGLILAVFSLPSWKLVRPKPVMAAAALLLVAAGAWSMQAAPHFRNPEAFFRYGIGEHPQNALLYNNHGFRLYHQDKFREAISDFDEALKLVPDYYTALMLRGVCRSRTGDMPGSLADLNAAARLRPGDMEPVFNRGVTLLKMGKVAEAENDFMAAARSPDYAAKSFLNLGRLYRDHGRPRDAYAFFDKAILGAPVAAEPLVERGILKYNDHDLDGAIEDMDRAIAVEAGSITAWTNKGALLGEQQKYQEALAVLDQAIRLDPSYALAYRNRGLIYVRLHDPGSAAGDFRAAARLGDGNAEALLRQNSR